MKYLKLFNEAYDWDNVHGHKANFIKIFKEAIDWKLIQYIQYILTEYWDKGICIDCYVNIENGLRAVYTMQFDQESGEDICNYQSDATEWWYYNCIKELEEGKKLQYVIRPYELKAKEKRVILENIIEKLNNKYDISYNVSGIQINFTKYNLKEK